MKDETSPAVLILLPEVPEDGGTVLYIGRDNTLPPAQRIISSHVSRKQFSVSVKAGGAPMLQALGRNATLLNGIPLKVGDTPARLKEGDVVTLLDVTNTTLPIYTVGRTALTSVLPPTSTSTTEEGKALSPAITIHWLWKSRPYFDDHDPRGWSPYSPSDAAKLEEAYVAGRDEVRLSEAYCVVFHDEDIGTVQFRNDDWTKWRSVRREAAGEKGRFTWVRHEDIDALPRPRRWQSGDTTSEDGDEGEEGEGDSSDSGEFEPESDDGPEGEDSSDSDIDDGGDDSEDERPKKKKKKLNK